MAGFASGAGAYINGMSAGGMVTKAATINQATGVVTKAAQLNFAGNMVRGAAMYLGAYASNKVAGLETHFNWTDMTVASVSSGITGQFSGSKVDQAISGVGKDFGSNLVSNFWGSTVNSSLSRLAGRGQKQNWGAMAADAFGNALASKVVQLASAPRKLAGKLGSV